MLSEFDKIKNKNKNKVNTPFTMKPQVKPKVSPKTNSRLSQNKVGKKRIQNDTNVDELFKGIGNNK